MTHLSVNGNEFFKNLYHFFLLNKELHFIIRTNVLVKVINMNQHEKIANRYLFTDMAITNLELDRKHLDNSFCKIKDPYFEVLDQLISTAIQERRRLKQLMYQHHLQVKHIKTDRLFSTYKYYLNGYVYEADFFNPVIKKYVKGIMNELIQQVMTQNKEPVIKEDDTKPM